jgi:hypothetical protein
MITQSRLAAFVLIPLLCCTGALAQPSAEHLRQDPRAACVYGGRIFASGAAYNVTLPGDDEHRLILTCAPAASGGYAWMKCFDFTGGAVCDAARKRAGNMASLSTDYSPVRNIPKLPESEFDAIIAAYNARTMGGKIPAGDTIYCGDIMGYFSPGAVVRKDHARFNYCDIAVRNDGTTHANWKRACYWNDNSTEPNCMSDPFRKD